MIQKENQAATVEIPTPDLSSIGATYELTDPRIIGFLQDHDSVVQLLEQATGRIRAYFGNRTKVYLELSNDSTGELFARIATSLEPKEAVALLDQFDREWWFDASAGAGFLLNFGLRYV